MDGVNINFRW